MTDRPSEQLLFEINVILNMHVTWKIKRALLRELGLPEVTVDELMPPESSL